ncbi:accessory factor UbiK family protein [Halomonas sp. WWR20]
MLNNDRLGRLAQQIGERLQDASHAPEDIQRNVQSVMRGAFDRLELVSREDFDILMDVLQRTRQRVEALEKQVEALEVALAAEAPATSAGAPGGASASAPATPAKPAASNEPAVKDAVDGAPSTPAEDAGGAETSETISPRGRQKPKA